MADYTPDDNFSGTDSIKFTVTSPNGISEEGNIYITISPVNDLPVLDEIASVSVDEDNDFITYFAQPVNNLDPATSLVFPNPAKNQFTITNQSASSIILYDVFGKRVLQQDLNNSKTIERGNLSSGMYFYYLKTKKKILKNGKVIFE